MMLTNQWLEYLQKNQEPKYVSNLLAYAVKEGAQFDCGDLNKIPFTKCPDDFIGLHAPYPVTLLQFEDAYSELFSHVLVFWMEKKDGGVMIVGAYKRRDDKSWRTASPVDVTFDGIVYSCEGTPVNNVFLGLAMNLFYVLGCSNVATIDNEPSAALNKKRAKAGKLPIVSFKTLVVVVDDKKIAGQPMGGTHSSPRVHLRRGHIRNIEGGRRVWVQSCVVGSKHGMVMKDYRITTKSALSTCQ